MAKIPLSKSQNKQYLQLPPEFEGIDEVELFKLKDGYYIVCLPLEKVEEEKQQPTNQNEKQKINPDQLSAEEIATLRKLVSIRFVDRVPNHVETVLNSHEKETLKLLQKKNLINIFKGNKYKDGVYNISDKAYTLITQNSSSENEQVEETQNQKQVNTNQSQPQPTQSQSSIALLKSQGFVVITDRNEAYNFSVSINSEMKRGDVVGIKGFDGKFYAVTKDYLQRGRESIIKHLKEDMPIGAIAEASKIDQNGALAIMRLMSEAGEIVEKRKGVFALA